MDKPNVPTRDFFSPIVEDSILIETTSAKVGQYSPLEVGQQYPQRGHSKAQTDLFAGHEFLGQRAVEGSDEVVQRIFATRPVRQDTYNFVLQYGGDHASHPILVRTYLERKDEYVVRTMGSALPGVYLAMVTAGGSGYTAATVTPSGGTGSGFAGTVIVSASGSVERIVVTAEGTYTAAPTLAISGDGTGATATAIVQDATTVLVAEKAEEAGEPWGRLWYRVTRVYETLPGPWLPFTRYDDDLGPIQGRRRSVLASGQEAELTGTSKTNYEARNGSAIVSIQIEEAWSDGTGSEGNPAYPILDADFFDDTRGAIQRRSQIVVATGSEAGSLSLSGGVVTRISYEPYNEFLLRRIVETWTVANAPAKNESKWDDERGAVFSVTQLVADTASVGSQSEGGGIVTEIRYEPFGEYPVRFSITEVWTVANAPVLDADLHDELKGPVQRRSTLVVRSAGPSYTEAGSQSESGGTVTETRYEPFNKVVLRSIVETWAVPGPVVGGIQPNDAGQQVAVTTQLKASDGYSAPANTSLVKVQTKDNGTWVEERLVTDPSLFTQPSYEKSRPDVTPAEFRALLQTTDTTVVAAGTASSPTLGTGELMRREQQIDAHTYRLTVSSRPAAAGQTITDTTTNAQGIVVTRQRIYKAEGAPANVPSATQTVRTDKLGDGNMVETVETEASLFTQPTFAVSRSDLTPQWVRALVEDTETSSIVAGTASLPTLVAGELSRSQQQLDAHTYRLAINARPISGTVSKTDYRTTPEGIERVVSSYGDAGTLAIESGLNVVASETELLGDGRMTRTTRHLDILPVLVSRTWDDFSQMMWYEQKSFVVPLSAPVGKSGYQLTEEKADNKWRSIQMVTFPEGTPATQITYGTAGYPFPAVLDSIGLEGILIIAISGNGLDTAVGYDIGVKMGITRLHGPFAARMTRQFSLTPFTALTPTKFQPRADTLVGRFYTAQTTSTSASASAQVVTFGVPETLHGNMTVSVNVTPDSLPGTVASLFNGLSLAATAPAALTPGEWILADVEKPKMWRGIWTRETLEVQIPS